MFEYCVIMVGGGCKLCGSVEHFKANCPTKHMTLTEGISNVMEEAFLPFDEAWTVLGNNRCINRFISINCITILADYLEQSNDDCSNQALSHRSKSKKKVVKF